MCMKLWVCVSAKNKIGLFLFAISHGEEDESGDQWFCMSLRGKWTCVSGFKCSKCTKEGIFNALINSYHTSFHQKHIIATITPRSLHSSSEITLQDYTGTNQNVLYRNLYWKSTFVTAAQGLQRVTGQWNCFWPLPNKPSLHKLYTKRIWEQILVIVIDISPRV